MRLRNVFSKKRRRAEATKAEIARINALMHLNPIQADRIARLVMDAQGRMLRR